MLYLVPRMYTPEELHFFIPEIPEDYPVKSSEFWSYVGEKLFPLKKVIKHVYRDAITISGVEGLKYIQEIDEACYNIIEKLVSFGASLDATEDPILLAEAESWASMMGTGGSNDAVVELFKENLEERNRYVAKVIADTLKSEEGGALFIETTRRVQEKLSSDIKVVKVCPFEPTDYVNSIISKKHSRDKLKREGV